MQIDYINQKALKYVFILFKKAVESTKVFLGFFKNRNTVWNINWKIQPENLMVSFKHPIGSNPSKIKTSHLYITHHSPASSDNTQVMWNQAHTQILEQTDLCTERSLHQQHLFTDGAQSVPWHGTQRFGEYPYCHTLNNGNLWGFISLRCEVNLCTEIEHKQSNILSPEA